MPRPTARLLSAVVASLLLSAVASWEDEAVGVMTKNERGVPWVSSVELRPRIAWSGRRPWREEEQRLHHGAHEQCFIANSVKTDIRVELREAEVQGA